MIPALAVAFVLATTALFVCGALLLTDDNDQRLFRLIIVGALICDAATWLLVGLRAPRWNPSSIICDLNGTAALVMAVALLVKKRPWLDWIP